LEQIRRFKLLEAKQIPKSVDYDKIVSLRFESRQKLKQHRPHSIGQAARISGVTPADIMILLVWLKKNRTDGVGDTEEMV
jgi:tRNA uridine 5-carboxymethylaminomethyl modification enzyme